MGFSKYKLKNKSHLVRLESCFLYFALANFSCEKQYVNTLLIIEIQYYKKAFNKKCENKIQINYFSISHNSLFSNN